MSRSLNVSVPLDVVLIEIILCLVKADFGIKAKALSTYRIPEEGLPQR